jgi:hypothetical protein
MERVLVPLAPELSSSIIAAIARAKHGELELFDITELSVDDDINLPTPLSTEDRYGGARRSYAVQWPGALSRRTVEEILKTTNIARTLLVSSGTVFASI